WDRPRGVPGRDPGRLRRRRDSHRGSAARGTQAHDGRSFSRRTRGRSGDAARTRMRPGLAARQAAHHILLRVDQSRAFADILLAERLAGASLDERDAALVTRLVYGTLAWQGRLDHHLAGALHQALGQLEPPVRAALRLGAFQLLFLDRVPAF